MLKSYQSSFWTAHKRASIHDFGNFFLLLTHPMLAAFSSNVWNFWSCLDHFYLLFYPSFPMSATFSIVMLGIFGHFLEIANVFSGRPLILFLLSW